MGISKSVLGVLVALCLSFSSVVGQLPTVMPTGKPDLVNITYTLGFTGNQPHAIFEIRAATRGYIGFGLSNNTCMTGSDAVVTFRDWSENYTITTQDWTFQTTGFPYDKFVDDQQDWNVRSYVWNDDNTTTLQIHRLYNTGDPWDIVFEDKTQNFIFAIGEYPALHSHQFDRSGNINFNLIRGVPFYQPENPSHVREEVGWFRRY